MKAYHCLLLACSLLQFAKAGFFLKVTFISYNNSLESYDDESSSSSDGAVTNEAMPCCLSQEDCDNVTCTTFLRYCFKNYNTSNDPESSTDCIENTLRGSGILPVDTLFIDYETFNTRSSLSYIGGTEWPGQIQFLVRASVGDVVEYFELNFELNVDETITETILGSFYGSYMTFKVTITVICAADFYGSNCEVYCRAEDSDDGHYTCDKDGNKQCLPGYVNTTTNCTTPCITSYGCDPNNGYCNTPGECLCLPGYTGDNCTEVQLSTVPLPSVTSSIFYYKSSLLSEIPTPTETPSIDPPTSSSSSSSSSVLIPGVAVGSALLIIILCVLTVIAIVALKRRMNAQTVDLKANEKDDKSSNRRSYRQDGGLDDMNNPTYDVAMSQPHTEKIPLNQNEQEYDFDNPLYMMGVQPLPTHNEEDVPTIKEHEYATTDDVIIPQPAAQSSSNGAQAASKDYYDDVVRKKTEKTSTVSKEPEYATTDVIIPQPTAQSSSNGTQPPSKDYYDDIVRKKTEKTSTVSKEPEYATTDDVILPQPTAQSSSDGASKDYYNDIVGGKTKKTSAVSKEPEYVTTDDIVPSKTTISADSHLKSDSTVTQPGGNKDVDNYDDVVPPTTSNAVSEATHYAEPDIGQSLPSPHSSPPSARPPSPVYAEPQVNKSSQQTFNNPPAISRETANGVSHHYEMADKPLPTGGDTIHRPSIYDSDTD